LGFERFESELTFYFKRLQYIGIIFYQCLHLPKLFLYMMM